MLRASEIMDRFSRLQVLVVGDVMMDRYISGKVERISPEAPVPVVHFQSEENRLGGAGNVALNLISLGARPILCSAIGDDAEGLQLADLLPLHGLSTEGLVRMPSRPTTLKTRVMAQHQHLVRIDREYDGDLSERETALFLDRISSLLREKEIDLIVFQDYNKGVLTEEVIGSLIGDATKRKISTAVDPKKKNFWAYRGVTLFKPNLKEVRDSLPFPIEPESDSLQKAAHFMREKLGHEITLITLSDRGLFIEEEGYHRMEGARPRIISDVCGAGDTVISVAALGMAGGLGLDEIAQLSNMAGGLVCEKVGVVPVDRTELLFEYESSQKEA